MRPFPTRGQDKKRESRGNSMLIKHIGQKITLLGVCLEKTNTMNCHNRTAATESSHQQQHFTRVILVPHTPLRLAEASETRTSTSNAASQAARTRPDFGESHLHPSVSEETDELDPRLVLEVMLPSQDAEGPPHAQREVLLCDLIDVSSRDGHRGAIIFDAVAIAPAANNGVDFPPHLQQKKQETPSQ